MPALSTHVHQRIAAPPDVVWAYRLDFSKLPEYNPSVVDLEQIRPAGPEGTGAEYRFDLVHEDTRHEVVLRVVASEPGRLVAIELGGALPAREELVVEACDPALLEPRPSGAPPGSAPPPAHSWVTLTLTLLVPDSWPQALHEKLLARAATDAEAELRAMAVLLATEAGIADEAAGDDLS